MSNKAVGKVIQITGPVLDIQFPDDQLPELLNAIEIDNQGNGFRDAVEQTKRTAAFRGLNSKDSLHLQLITEEMLSLARSVTGEMKASFWIEGDDGHFDLHLSTETVMDKEKRALLISSATSRKNDAAKGFLGKLIYFMNSVLLMHGCHPSFNCL